MKLKDWSNRLVLATILITVVRYSAAFMASDVGQITGVASDVVTFFLTLTGLGMGILDTVGGGLLFNGWSRVFPKAGSKWSLRFWILTFCVITLLVSGLVILVPFTVSRIAHESVLDALGGKESIWTWVWSTMVNLIPYVLIIGVFTGNKMVTSLEGEQVTGNIPSHQEGDKKVSSNLPTDWRKIRPKLNKNQLEFIAFSEPKEIVAKLAQSNINVSPRTASNWRANAREELGVKEGDTRPPSMSY